MVNEHGPLDDTEPRGIGHLDTGPLPVVPAAGKNKKWRRGPDWSTVLTAGLAVGLAGGLISAGAAMGYARPLTIFRRHVVASEVPGPVRTEWRTRTVEYGPVPDPVALPQPTVTVTVTGKAAPRRTVTATRTVAEPGSVKTVTATATVPGPTVTKTVTVTVTDTATIIQTVTAPAPAPDAVSTATSSVSK